MNPHRSRWAGFTASALALPAALLATACGAETALPATDAAALTDLLAADSGGGAGDTMNDADVLSGEDVAVADGSELAPADAILEVSGTNLDSVDASPCPVWVPTDEPDFGKPEQAKSTFEPCSSDKLCPEGQMCTVDWFPAEGVTEGGCMRVCFHPESDFPSDLGCHPTEYCSLNDRCLSQFEDPTECLLDRNHQKIGFCGPKNTSRGGPGGTWDYFNCPCDHPGLDPEQKAMCDANWSP